MSSAFKCNMRFNTKIVHFNNRLFRYNIFLMFIFNTGDREKEFDPRIPACRKRRLKGGKKGAGHAPP